MVRQICILSACALVITIGETAIAQSKPKQSRPEEATYEYVIQPGDTCAGIAERLFGDKRRWDLIHKHNPGMGPTPHRLVAGKVLIMPRPDESPDAKLTDVQRTVQARAPQEPEWERARRGKELYRGWRVNTLERASADVTFRDGALVQMRQNTLIIIYGGVYRDARRKTTEASLERGALRSRLHELRLSVTTPTAAAGLSGGSSVVSVDGQGTSVLSNHEGGEAQFEVAQGQAVRVKPGYGSKVGKGDKRPSEPKPLPPAPQWLDDVAEMFGGVRSAGGTVRGAWTPIEAAASYQVEIARGADGGEVVVATEVPAAVTRFELHGVPEGDYFARVSTIDDAGFESPQSEPHAMVVRLIGLDEPGPDDETGAPSGTLTSAPPAPRVLPGTRVLAPTGFSCSVDGGDKAEVRVLSEGGARRVECLGADGAVMPEVEVAVIAPKLTVIKPEPLPPLVRGAEPLHAVIAVTSELPLPAGARFRAPNGIVVEEVYSIDDKTALELSATEDSPDEFALQLVADSGDQEAVIGAIAFNVEEPVALDFAPNEALGLALSPNVLGLMNDRREGSGTFLTLAYLGDPAADNGYYRLNTGVEIAPIRRVRFGLAIPLDLYTRGTVPDRRGAQDFLLWTGVRVFMRRDLSMDTEIAVWIPSSNQRDASIARTRVIPALSISYLFNERWLFRSRQAAILEASSGGPFLWASAYGIDIKVVRLFAINAELDMIFGRSLGQAVTGVGAGPGLSVLLGPASLYFSARFAATNDFEAASGKYTLTGGLRLSFY